MRRVPANESAMQCTGPHTPQSSCPPGPSRPLSSALDAHFAPTVMALLSDAALTLLRRRGVCQISARLRDHRQHPAAAVALLVAPPPVDATALPPFSLQLPIF